jgi:hypothetical protein
MLKQYQGFGGGVRAAQQSLETLGTGKSYRPKRNVFYDPEFREDIKKAGITKETPLAFLGAYATRLGADLTTDELRSLYWQMSHPLEMADQTMRKVVDPNKQLGYGRGLIALTAVAPAVALTGAYNPLNIGELGRPTGYKQNAPDPEDPTKTTEPGTELFQRFFQGRTGRPLAFEKAREEIPDLTKQRYANYMNFLYNDPGPIGKATMGIVKVTPENLQGDPEARVLGYPVSIPSVIALAGGITGARMGILSSPTVERTVQPSLLQGEKATTTRTMGRKGPVLMRGLAGGALGSAAGAIAGVLANQAIAAAGNTQDKLPMQ